MIIALTILKPEVNLTDFFFNVISKFCLLKKKEKKKKKQLYRSLYSFLKSSLNVQSVMSSSVHLKT